MMKRVFIKSMMVLSFLTTTNFTFATEGLAETTITLEQSAYFLATDRSDVLIPSDTYIVEAEEEWLRLIPGERRDALLLEATRTPHDENLTQATRTPSRTKKPPVMDKSHPMPRSPKQRKEPLTKRVQTLERQLHSLQSLVHKLQDQLNTITSVIQVNNSGQVTIGQAGPVIIEASILNINASSINADAGMSQFSGVVQSDTLITNSVVSSSYTPGAGNIW